MPKDGIWKNVHRVWGRKRVYNERPSWQVAEIRIRYLLECWIILPVWGCWKPCLTVNGGGEIVADGMGTTRQAKPGFGKRVICSLKRVDPYLNLTSTQPEGVPEVDGVIGADNPIAHFRS